MRFRSIIILPDLLQAPALVLVPRREGLHILSVHNVHIEHFNLGG